MGKLKIGWARRNVSVDGPVNIPGQMHMRISQGISDPVFVTALVLDDGADSVIFLSADLVVIRSGLLDAVRAAVNDINPDIPTEKILMNATHTHEAPSHYYRSGTLMPVDSMPNVGIEIASADDYRHFLAGKAAEAVCEAYESRKEGGAAYGYGYAVVAHSRRVVYFDDISKRGGNVNGFSVDGHGKMYGNTNDDNFSHYEAGADHFVNLLFTFDIENKLTGAIINLPCPSQCSEHEYKISSDYWNEVRSAVEERFGDIFILPQCAAAGDLSPRILHYKKAQERRFRLKYGDKEHTRAERSDIAQRIAEAFEEVYSWAKKDIKTDLKINHVATPAELAKRLITDEEYAFAAQGLAGLEGETFKTRGDSPENLLKHNSLLVAQRNRYKNIIERYEGQKTEPTLPMEMHVVRVGDIAFASNSFELYMDYMHRTQARSPFEQTFVIQLAGTPGDGGTYLATQRGAEAKGYSACLFCNLVSPEGGQQLVNETLKVLKEIY